MKRLDGRGAVVTGAASGIGRALARELSARGAQLALMDKDVDGLESICDELGALPLACDVRDEEHVRLAAEQARQHLGRIDLLLANAGVATVGSTFAVPLDDARWVIDINLVGTLIVTQQFVPAMKEAGRGHVAFTASVAGLIGAPGMAAYTASKFAVVGMAESLRVELAGTGLTVTTICPGYVRTGLHRATRYTGEGFASFLDSAPSWFGLSAEQVAKRGIDATLAGKPMLTLGPEKAVVWLKRFSPRAYAALAGRAARAAGLFDPET